MSALVDAAIEYLNAGLTVFALAGKQPNTQIEGEGWREISGAVEPGDEVILAAVFDHPATTGIGIVIPNGMAVVDIDGEEGAIAFNQLMGGGGFFDGLREPTAVAATGRGLHLWYITIGEVRSTKLAEKLDLKGVGGYVAAPPSRHPSGAVYTWIEDLVRGRRLTAALIPNEIMELLAVRESLHDRFARDPDRVYTRAEYHLEGSVLVPVIVPATMEGLAGAVAKAADGERNNMLNWAAYKARLGGFSLQQVMAELGTAAAEAGLGQQEIKQTIRSAFRG
jgi:bifunctional DNA primase/polymerase-like protein